MISLQIERDEWTPAFNEYERRWSDLSPTKRQVSDVVVNSIRENYRTEGASSGFKWQSRTKHYAWPLLQKSNKMMSAQLAAAYSHYEHSGNVHTMSFDKVNNATPYAKFHAYGTSKMVARPTMRLTACEFEKIERIIADYSLRLK